MFTPLQPSDKIVITGAAGLVGQNLCRMLRAAGYTNLVGIDKRGGNLRVLAEINPGIRTIEADLSQPGAWMDAFADARAVIQMHAHIGSLVPAEYVADNLTATEHVLAACHRHRVSWLVHASSSVVHSQAVDDYTETKKAQEAMVRASGIPHVILRPTLMFGLFDRKHLGWLARFMQKTPVFPIPGHGRYLRQPLFVRDFCGIVLACLKQQPAQEIYDITGAEEMDYLEMMRDLKTATGAKTRIIRLPAPLFGAMLDAVGLVSKHPPFTRKQMEALMTPDHFTLIPWWEIFGVPATPWKEALRQTFRDPEYSHIALEF